MLLSVSVRSDHPTGSRCRAGLTFGRKAQTFDVTEEQAAAIVADEWLDVEYTQEHGDPAVGLPADVPTLPRLQGDEERVEGVSLPPCPECAAEWVDEGGTMVQRHEEGCPVPAEIEATRPDSAAGEAAAQDAAEPMPPVKPQRKRQTKPRK